MSDLVLTLDDPRERLGLKGPRAAEWLVAHGIVDPYLEELAARIVARR